MPERMTTEEFIFKAAVVHGDRYDYSSTNYIGSKDRVAILCRKHGEFWQSPNHHLRGSGCPGCAQNQKLTTENFIKKSRAVHGDRYDYSKVEYLSSQSKVIITCKKHGDFRQRPDNHLNSNHGCPKCGQLDRGRTNLERYGHPNAAHNAVARAKIRRTCLERYGNVVPMRSEIVQKARAKALMPGMTGTSQLRIKSAFDRLNDEKWLREAYVIRRAAIDDIAHELGLKYPKLIYSYLKKFNLSRRNGRFSMKAIRWLNRTAEESGIVIRHAMNGGEVKIFGTPFFADGYCEETNTVYEFYGDYWHGNPNLFDDEKAKNRFEATTARENQIKKLGFNLISIWEEDFKNERFL